MKLIFHNKNIKYFLFITIIFACYFAIFYLIFNQKPFFVSNDSFQYLDFAKKIYNEKKITGIVRFALNIYYDELALFNYDFNQIKPYHFPSYSVFLSLFYYIYNNDNFVVYASQFLSFIIFSFSFFLIFQHYLSKKESFNLTIISIFFSCIMHYAGDSSKEILFSGLATLLIYLLLYSPNKFKNLNLIISCFILIFLCITRSFYLLLSLLICLYHIIPNKFKYNDENSLSTFNKFKILTLIFIIPLLCYIYFYYMIEIHYFLFNNKSKIYADNTIRDLLLRIFTNLFLGIIIFYSNYFEFNESLYSFHLHQFFGFSIIGFLIYFKINRGKIFIKYFKISKLTIINLFYFSVAISVIIRFSILGYRLTIGYIPIFFLLNYIYFFKNKNFLIKLMYHIFLIINLIFNYRILINNIKINDNYFKKNEFILNKIKNYESINIAYDISYFPNYSLPLLYIFKKNINFYIDWSKYLCQNLEYYENHNINFKLIFVGKKIEESCDFIKKKYVIEHDEKDNIVYRKL